MAEIWVMLLVLLNICKKCLFKPEKSLEMHGRGLTLGELLRSIEEEDYFPTTLTIDINLMPPVNASDPDYDTDEDSGDKDEADVPCTGILGFRYSVQRSLGGVIVFSELVGHTNLHQEVRQKRVFQESIKVFSQLRIDAKPEGQRNLFRADFTNIRGLAFNINYVHQHLQTEKPHILALMETQVDSSTLDNLLRYPGYELCTRFRGRFGVCVYVKAGISCHRDEDLEPEGFDIIWLKMSSKNNSKFICYIYRPPSTKWDDLRDYYQSFPWNDVCFKSMDPTACAREITEVLMSGMEAYIPHVVKHPSKNKPWSNQSCRDAVTSKNQKYREWRKNPCTESHRSFTEARNRCKRVIDSSKEDHNKIIKNKLLSISYEQGVFPSSWKIGCVQPMPKKGKKPALPIIDLWLFLALCVRLERLSLTLNS
nr:unnamed protein product [Callosobruchus analis]